MDHQVVGGRYELERLIGRGGMARVYLARDRILKRQDAVKILYAGDVTDPLFVERFRREARAAAALSHPNIVTIFDWGEDEGRYYMVMEYVPGENLKQIITRRGALPEAEALDIAAQVAAALQVAHDHGVIHRDVKPQNILVEPSGHVKMTDFGIARAAGLTQLTATNVVAGTPHYLAPEAAQQQPVDNRADIYGLGVVLYEMVTGKELFSGGSLIEVALRHVHDEPPSPRQAQPSLSPATEAIILKALAKRPADRFATAAEMRDALVADRETLLRPATVPDPQATVRVPEAAATAAAATVPAIAGESAEPLGETARWRMRQPPARPRLRADGTPANLWWRVIPVAVLLLALAGGLATLNAQNQLSHHTGRVASRPNPTSTPHRRATPKPTSRPVLHPRVTPAPTSPPATSPPPTVRPKPKPVVAPPAAPTATVAFPTATSVPVAVAAAVSSPVNTVEQFYQLVSAHQFSAAASLWSASMQSNYPPGDAINGRFSHTRNITVNSANKVSGGSASGSATVDVDLTETFDNGTSQQLVGSWTLILTPSGWLMDSPHFGGGGGGGPQGDIVVPPEHQKSHIPPGQTKAPKSKGLKQGLPGNQGDGNNGQGNGD